MSPILAYPGRRLRNPYTTVYDCIRSINGTYPAVLCRVAWPSITIVFHRFVFEGIQSFPIANDLSSTSPRVVNDGCARNFRAVLNDDDKQPFSSIRRWSSFTVSDTAKYDRNTTPCYTAQYDRRRLRWSYMAVNDRRCLTWASVLCVLTLSMQQRLLLKEFPVEGFR